MQTQVFSLKRSGSKLFTADEKFWDNVNYMTFHSEYLEIRLKRGRPTSYLHYWFFEIVESGEYTDQKRKEIYAQFPCSYCFPKENGDLLNYLYEEAKNRNVLKYFNG